MRVGRIGFDGALIAIRSACGSTRTESVARMTGRAADGTAGGASAGRRVGRTVLGTEVINDR
jgi:hypothetical protein